MLPLALRQSMDLSPAQTGTGKQGPPAVRLRITFTRVFFPPNEENRGVQRTDGLIDDGRTGRIAARPGFRPVLRSLNALSLLQGDPVTVPAA
jgi:hypothetical protein